MPVVKSSKKSRMNVITQMLNVIALILVTSEVIAACIDVPESALRFDKQELRA
jgi:hypothetical protein